MIKVTRVIDEDMAVDVVYMDFGRHLIKSSKIG